MDWTGRISLRLIELYKEQECLWNPEDEHYRSKWKKTEAWNKIGESFECDPSEGKKKIESLLTSFRRERQKQKDDSKYQSSWFAFQSMSFLMDKFAIKKNNNTDEESLDEIFLIKEENPEEITSLNEEANVMIQIEKVQAPPSPPPVRKRAEKRKSLFTSSIKKRGVQNRNTNFINRADEAYNILKEALKKRNERDESTIFGEHVASKLRQYNQHTRNVVEHLIGNILFNADMGKYEKPLPFNNNNNMTMN